MPKTPTETAQEIVRRNNEKAVEGLTAMSPDSRQSLRQASLSSKQKTAETLKPRKHSQGKHKSPLTKKNKDGTAEPEARKNKSPNAQKDKHVPTVHESGATVLGRVRSVPINNQPTTEVPSVEKGSTSKQKPKRYPDYSGCVVSYICPVSQRPGHGIVGKCNHAEGTYEVQLTFADNEEPKGQTDSCVLLQFVEEHMVDDEAAQAWTSAVARHLLLDSPTTKTTHKLPRLPKSNKPSTSSAITTRKNLSIKESQAEGSPETTPTKGGSKRKRKSSVQVDPGVQAMIIHHVREATYDIRPNVSRIRPFMYWDPNKETACAKMLIKRTPALRVMAEGQRRHEFARGIAGTVKAAANNERSAQVRQIKMVYLDDKSDFAIVSDYVIGASANGALKHMRIGNALSGEFENIDDLRNALHSPTMYTYENLFDLFCAALESGRFRGTEHMPISPIENLITVAHEAHFRLELWYALQAQSFRHDTAKSAQEERKEKHTNLCILVAQDRRENGTLANKHRNTTRATNDDDSHNSDSDSDEGLDSQYY